MKIRDHRELDVYKLAFKCAMEIFEISKSFPKEEKYSLTDQIRRSSRSVCANISEAFRKRDIKNPSFQNWLILKAKVLKRKLGFNLPMNVNIWVKNNPIDYPKNMI